MNKVVNLKLDSDKFNGLLEIDEYKIIINSIELIKNVDGLTCEIGVREGDSSHLILEYLVKTGQLDRVHICIDPFGNIEYEHWENVKERLDYTNKMKNKMLANLYSYVSEIDMECLYFPLEDTEFFNRYKDGVPIYNNYKKIVNKYALVFLDGPHTTELVLNEFNFFKDKIDKGGIIIFDDIHQYPHMEKLDQYIRENNFDILEKGPLKKISYIKI